jgi:hypothetical protein
MIADSKLKALNLPSSYNRLSAINQIKQLEFSHDYFNSEKSSRYSSIAIYSSYFIATVAVLVSVCEEWFLGHPARQAVAIILLTGLAGGFIIWKISGIRAQIHECNALIKEIREESGKLMVKGNIK